MNIRKAAYNYLSRRDHSRHELTQKLLAKGYLQTDIDALLDELAREGLMNEERFIENFIYWRLNRGYGPLRINMELQTKGLSAEMIAQHLDITDNAWSVAAKKVWQKRFGGKSLKNIKEKARQQRFLQQRGYTHEQIKNIFNPE